MREKENPRPEQKPEREQDLDDLIYRFCGEQWVSER